MEIVYCERTLVGSPLVVDSGSWANLSASAQQLNVVWRIALRRCASSCSVVFLLPLPQLVVVELELLRSFPEFAGVSALSESSLSKRSSLVMYPFAVAN